jgi:hypothetical protein
MKKTSLLGLPLFICAAAFAQTPPVIANQCQNNAGPGPASTISCTITGLSSGLTVLVHTSSVSTVGGATISDSSTGGGTPDTFLVGNACQFVTPYYSTCSDYVCKSSLNSGDVTFTTTTGAAVTYLNIDVEVISGSLTTGCHAENGWNQGFLNIDVEVNTGQAGGPFVDGMISEPFELAIAFIATDVVPVTGAGWTQVQTNGGFQSQYLSNPLLGARLTSPWTLGSVPLGWIANIDTFLSPLSKVRHTAQTY